MKPTKLVVLSALAVFSFTMFAPVASARAGKSGPQHKAKKHHKKKRHAQHAFKRLDKNGDGVLDASEIAASRDPAKLALLDLDGDGQITKAEFKQALAQKHTQKHTDKRFGNLDTNGDGVLDAAEIAASKHAALLATADTDGDGQVSKAEFDAAVQQHATTARQVHQAFKTADTNGDHKLDQAEWTAAAATATFSDVDADGDGVVTGHEIASYMVANGGTSPF